MEGGDLSDSINTHYEMSERDVQRLMKQVFSAVIHLQGLGIMHRDLKPENLLLTHEDLKMASVKISDFGLACKDEKSMTIAGTQNYIAPEIISNKAYDKRCDLWSLGVILFLLLSGDLPF